MVLFLQQVHCVSQTHIILCAQVDLPAYLHSVIYIYIYIYIYIVFFGSINGTIVFVRLRPLYLPRQGDWLFPCSPLCLICAILQKENIKC